MTTATMNQTTGLEAYITEMTNVAIRAAVEYLKKLGVASGVDAGELSEAIRREVKSRLDEAIADCTAACECGMEQAGDMTFRLTMAQAGIAAAKSITA